MAKYTEDNGYAIMLYRPSGKSVTAETGSAITQGDLAAKASHMDVGALVDYVINGTDAKQAAVMAGKRAQVAEVLRARALSHTAHVAEEYGKQLKKVPEMHAPDAKHIAKLHMTEIAARVHASLSAARKNTETLF
jgi:hypothetical protein